MSKRLDSRRVNHCPRALHCRFALGPPAGTIFFTEAHFPEPTTTTKRTPTLNAEAGMIAVMYSHRIGGFAGIQCDTATLSMAMRAWFEALTRSLRLAAADRPTRYVRGEICFLPKN